MSNVLNIIISAITLLLVAIPFCFSFYVDIISILSEKPGGSVGTTKASGSFIIAFYILKLCNKVRGNPLDYTRV